MRLTRKTKRILRNYANALFHQKKGSLSRRRYVFYLALRSSLGWVKDSLIDEGLEEDEAESEIFLLTTRLFKKYNPERSSIVPYIEGCLSYKAADLIRKHKEPPALPPRFLHPEESYEIEGEYYLTGPGFLFENRWLAKNLSRSQKHLILKVLMTDSTGARSLANNCLLGKSTVTNQLQDIAGIMEGRF